MVLKVEDTAMMQAEDESDQALGFDIIKFVMKNVNRGCGHRYAAHPDLPYWGLMFQGDMEELSLASHVIPLVMTFGDNIRDVRIEYPELGIATGLSLVLELYGGGRATTEDELPHYSPTSFRVDKFEEELESKIPKDFEKHLPKSWKLTLNAMKVISEMVNNMENSRHKTTLDFLGTDDESPTGDCVLTFKNVKEIGYPFLEEVFSVQGGRIEDVKFVSKSEDDRRLVFSIAGESSKVTRAGKLPKRGVSGDNKKRKRE